MTRRAPSSSSTASTGLRSTSSLKRPTSSRTCCAHAGPSAAEALLTAPRAEECIQSHTTVELEAGRGIVGDRYFDGTGTFSASEKHGQELTLMEAEVLDALHEDGLEVTPADARRNVVT